MKPQNDMTRSELDHQRSGASMSPIDDGEAAIVDDFSEETALDDQGTDQAEAVGILAQVLDTAFDSSNKKLALALGRSSEEISDWLSGNAEVDSDTLIKLRALADERSVEID